MPMADLQHCSLDNLEDLSWVPAGRLPFCSKVTVMRSSSAEVSLSPLSAFTGTAPAVSPALLFAVILLSSRVPVLSELKVPYPQRRFPHSRLLLLPGGVLQIISQVPLHPQSACPPA